MVIGFSGHRDIIAGDESRIKDLLFKKLRSLKEFEPIHSALVGTAQGADQLFIEACKELKLSVRDLNDEVERAKHESDSDYYSKQSNYLISECDQFIVAWDGVFTEEPGGTSWLVRQLMDQESRHIVHHLITPRKSNPYPISSLNAKGLEPANNDLNSKLPWVPEFHWVNFWVGDGETRKEHREKNNWIPFSHSLWQSFIVPGIFAGLTILFGIVGFAQISNGGFADLLFKSIDILSLNGIILEESNAFLEAARITGLLTPLTAIAFALHAATSGLRNKQKLRNWMKEPETFVVITGENKEANDLASDLNKRGFKILLLALNQNEESLTRLNKNLMRKNFFSDFQNSPLHEVVSNAGLIYLMDDDESNLQLALKLDTISQRSKFKHLNRLFVHLSSLEKSKFLHNNVGTDLKDKLKVIDIQLNTVRRLLNYYPVEWGSSESSAIAVHVIEYNDLSHALCEHLLTQLHLEPNRQVELTIHSENPEKAKADFFQSFSALALRHEKDRIENYTWGNWEIRFVPYSTNISFDQEFYSRLSEDLRKKKMVSLYLCSENTTESASWLAAYLPRLDQAKKESQQKLQVFCHYSNPDKAQELQVERFLNRLAPNTFVRCFGNLLDECSYTALNIDTLYDLAIEIAAWYDREYGAQSSNPLNNWNRSSLQSKRSNRQAADHIWMKWRWLLRHSQKEWSDIKESFGEFERLNEKMLLTLSEMEHRRWSADLIMQGFQPLPEQYRNNWKTEKETFKSQFYHKDLLPFNQLTEEDKEKDTDQIEGIPEFVTKTYLK